MFQIREALLTPWSLKLRITNNYLMKKFLTFGAAVLIYAGAFAGEPSITTFDDQMYVGGYMPECISANAQYVCGSTYVWAGFISEWQKQNNKVYLEEDGSSFADYGCDLPFITSNGVAIGFDDLGAIMIDFPNNKITRPRLGDRNIGLATILPDQMTEDGSIIVGLGYYTERKLSNFQSEHYIDNQAAYWENGECHFLPVPSEEELGYYYLGSRARCVSADGSVIMGSITDRLNRNPMVIWYRQADGSYVCDPVCDKYFSDIQYNDGTMKEFATFQGQAMSNDGSKVAMVVRKSPQDGGDRYDSPPQIAMYDTKTKELTVIPVDPDGVIGMDKSPGFFWTGIANDGTMVGWVDNGLTSFIVYPDEMKPILLADAFDTLGELADFDDIGTNKVSSITPDAKYICGVGWTENAYMGWYVGYVLDTGIEPGESSVDAIDDVQESAPVYYSVSGQRLASPVKGINIMVSNGKAEKVLVK